VNLISYVDTPGTYPGETDVEVDRLLEERVKIRDSNVDMSKNSIPKYEALVALAGSFKAAPKTWGDAAALFGATTAAIFLPSNYTNYSYMMN